MSHLTIKTGPNKVSKNSQQTIFNRQYRKINALREEIKLLTSEYEKALAFYHSTFKSQEQAAGKIVTEFLLKIIDLTEKPKALTKKERSVLHDMLANDIDLVFSIVPYNDLNEKLKNLYKEIHGNEFEDEFYSQINLIKETIKDSTGMEPDIDLSTFNPGDRPEEIIEKFTDFFKSFKEKMEDEAPFLESSSRKKTKKQLEKEERQREIESLQNKSLGNIYKSLVKKLHPDLEQDPEVRAAKENLMKNLTVAYEKQDLLSLLEIESNWFGDLSNTGKELREEDLKIYNSILKEQVKDLEGEIECIPLHYRYAHFSHFVDKNCKKPLNILHKITFEHEQLVDEFSKRLEDLSQENALKILKNNIAVYRDNGSFPDNENFLQILQQFESCNV